VRRNIKLSIGPRIYKVTDYYYCDEYLCDEYLRNKGMICRLKHKVLLPT
jgi:hypothetical protein